MSIEIVLVVAEVLLRQLLILAVVLLDVEFGMAGGIAPRGLGVAFQVLQVVPLYLQIVVLTYSARF